MLLSHVSLSFCIVARSPVHQLCKKGGGCERIEKAGAGWDFNESGPPPTFIEVTNLAVTECQNSRCTVCSISCRYKVKAADRVVVLEVSE